jgi:hypothetical protein
MIPKQIWSKERNAFALFCGIIASLIPNNKSNIHPVLMGIILSILLTKIVYGDYDRGYTWSVNDIYFVVIVGSLGAFGAWLSTLIST